MFQAISLPLNAPSPSGGPGPFISGGQQVAALERDPPERTSTPSQPRELAQNIDFGHAAYGTADALGFLDRLEVESRSASPIWSRTRRNRAASANALAYWKEPRVRLLQTYTDMLRSSLPAAAAEYRKAVTDSIRGQSVGEARLMDDWFELGVTFLRRVAELQTSVLRHASANVKPFAEAELERQTERGLTMLRAQPIVVPVTGTTASVLAGAEAERSRRLAEIDTFYEQALTGDAIVGVPATNLRLAYWLRDGRLIFRNLDIALAMSPRPVFIRHRNYWPTSIRRSNEFRYGPAQFHGPLPTTIEYVDPDHVPRFGVSSEAGFKVIETDFPLDRDHKKDRYRTGKQPWRTFPQMTTLELELRKVTGYARLHHAAEQAIAKS